VTKSHSRSRVSNDCPYSESQFKTLKYCPTFPGTFATLEAARTFCTRFFDAHNNNHRHAGLGLLTPAVVHAGQAENVRAQRALVLESPPTPETPTDSGTRRSHHDCPSPPGSTAQRTPRPTLTNNWAQLPQRV